MNLLTNPLVLRMAMVLLAAAFAFAIGAALIRLLRRISPAAAAEELRSPPRGSGMQLEAYHGVIQRLKEQETELARLRKLEHDRAAASENISEAVLSNLTSGVLLFNTAGILTRANDSARTILGYASPTGLHGRDVFRGLTAVRTETGDAPPASYLLEALDKTLKEGQAFRRIEADYVTPAGESRVLGITLSPVRAPAGEALGAACLVSDLTAITNLARQMRTKEDLAALGEMSAGIAHEFKNSLATISGYAQMLSDETDLANVHQFARSIASESANLTRVVTDLLKFARPLELTREEVDVRATLQDCARECPIELRVEGIDDSLVITGDSTALRQAFSNLLRNSAEAASNGVPTVVEVSSRSHGDRAVIVVRDNGRGIAPQQLPKIFIPFFTTKAQGSGLGLALVHRVVTEHGGSISVKSGPEGTAFTITLPAAARAVAVGERT